MQHPTKTRAILVAAAAIAAAGAFTTALGEEMVSHTTAPTVLSSEMTLGETATTTTLPPSAPPTPVAEPTLKADKPCGFTSSC
jgi:hypothetical protein